jgi:pimeloyl-ACP methyl ester carboxylesterase
MAYLNIGGREYYYVWRGHPQRGAPALVFLHDGLGAVRSWRAVPEQLVEQTGLPALVYDRWGYGRSGARPDFPYAFMESEVEPLGVLLRELGIPRAHLVGHSDGGSIALLFAAAHPERVLTLTSEAAHVFVEPVTQAGIRELVAMQHARRTPPWLAKLHGARSEELLRIWSAGWLSDEHARWNIAAAVRHVRCPLLAIQGDRDEFGTLAQLDAIQRQAPHAERWVVPGSGHTPHVQQEARYVERVARFIASHGWGGRTDGRG